MLSVLCADSVALACKIREERTLCMVWGRASGMPRFQKSWAQVGEAFVVQIQRRG